MASVSMKLSWAQVVKGKEEASIDSTKSSIFESASQAPVLMAALEAVAARETVAEESLRSPSVQEASVVSPAALEPAPPRAPPVVCDGSATRKPGSRGDQRCWCRGEFLVMLGHYGWILALDDIEHPDVNKNGGRIYIQRRDLLGQWNPKEGDIVGFYLYADQQGLGAEACCLEQTVPKCRPEDVGEYSEASTEVPTSSSEEDECVPNGKRPVSGFNASAMEFIPSATFARPSMHASAAEFVPGKDLKPSSFHEMIASMINPAYLSDESDSEDDDSGSEADKESNSDGNDLSSNASVDLELDGHLKVALLHAPWKSRPRSPPMESESSRLATIRAPPGLSLPSSMSPPPGLMYPPGLGEVH